MKLIFVFLEILLLLDYIISECEFTNYQNQRGFCIIDPQCCRGIAINNLCSDDDICCYGRHDCLTRGLNERVDQISNHCPTITSRQSWKARNPLRRIPSISAVNHVFVHHTKDGNSCFSTDSCTLRLRSLQSYHQFNNNWSDIAWNFVIGGNGQVYSGLGWNHEGFHTLNWNSQSLGIALIGNFDEEIPSIEMLNSLEDLISCGLSRGYIRTNYRIHGHRDVRQTSCPGENLYYYMRGMSNFQAAPLTRYN